MSEDARSIARSRRPHRPILIVANPGPDSDSGDDNAHSTPARPAYPHHPYNNSPTANSIPTSSSYRESGPLSTAHAPHHPASQSNPTLSSPSGTSSPPPSTPGHSLPPVDINGDGLSHHDPLVSSYSTDALQQQHPHQNMPHITPSRTNNFFGKIKSHIPHPRMGHDRRMSSNSRPPSSPSAATSSDTYLPRHSSDARSSPSEKTIICVTRDSEIYSTVDITGFRDALFIKELVFSKLQIYDEDQSQYSVYRTEIGAYALGDALKNEQLFELCRDQGDAKGSLKFLVAPSLAHVHEVPPPSPATLSNIPPPFIPHSGSLAPLRTRSRHEHESVSSASERMHPEVTNGYDPSVSDDMDGPDPDSQRSTLRPPPRQPTASLSTQNLAAHSSAQQNCRRQNGPSRPLSPLNNGPVRAISPSPLLSPDRTRQPPGGDYSRRVDRSGPQIGAPSSFYPQSPDPIRTPHDEEQNGATPWPLGLGYGHGRSGSDAAAERERALQASEVRTEMAARQWLRKEERERDRERQISGHSQGSGQDRDRIKRKPALKKDTLDSGTNKATRDRERDQWVLVSNSSDRASPSQESAGSGGRLQRSGRDRDRDFKYSPRFPASSAYNRTAYGLSHAPRQPPPAPPGKQAVPSNWAFVTYKGPGAPAAPTPPFNLKMAKSVDSMRDKFNHPGALTPGGSGPRRGQPPPPPPLPKTPGSSTVKEASLGSAGAPSGTPSGSVTPASGYVSGDSLSFSPRRERERDSDRPRDHVGSPETPRSMDALRPNAFVSPTNHRPVRPLPTQTPSQTLTQNPPEVTLSAPPPPPPPRALPSNGMTNGLSTMLGLLSPQQDPYPRPRSSQGDEPIPPPPPPPPPPYRPQRPVDSSVFSEPLQEQDTRSPQSHPMRLPPVPTSSRPQPSPSYSRDENSSAGTGTNIPVPTRALPAFPPTARQPVEFDRNADAYGGLVDSFSFHSSPPPRSPVSPRSPRFGPRPDPSITATGFPEGLRSPSTSQQSQRTMEDARTPDATIMPEDRTRLVRDARQLIESQSNPGEETYMPRTRAPGDVFVLPTIPPPPPLTHQPTRSPAYIPPPPPLPPIPAPAPAPVSAPAPAPTPAPSTPDTPESQSTEQDESDSESGTLWQKPMVEDDGGGTLWQTPMPERPKSSGGRGPPLTVQIDGQPNASSSQGKSSGSGYTTLIPANFPPPPKDPPPSPPLPHWKGGRTPTARMPGSASSVDKKTPKSDGTFQDSSWASRPNPEDVYERLEDFFPGHDLDKPVIEASSGGTSPTAAEYPPTAGMGPQPFPTTGGNSSSGGGPPSAMPADNKRFRHKKSIRVVAEEHKQRIDRTSRMQSASVSNVLRKRSTKLWGSRLEEVTSNPGPSTTPDSPSSSATTVPKPIFKWVRGELIGKGNFGRVYLALNATTGEMIAVKQVEIPRTASDKSDTRQMNVVEALKLESETLKDLDHPNIVQYLGFEETPAFLSIFLEYVPGGSVGSCLRRYGRFDEDTTKSFTAQILAGLEYLHSKGILHRDLKADNILVEQTGVCKISDFGISKRTDDINGQNVLTAMQGTVFWMAPEVVNAGKRGYNAKVDIWSVGCVVLEMWAGERPWRKEEAMAVIVKLYSSKQAPPIPSGITLSALADDFRKLCFAVNPDERPSAAELRKHPYLVLPPGWTFNGFSLKEGAMEDSDY